MSWSDTQVAIRGAPAKGVDGLNRARVQIPLTPPKKHIRKYVLFLVCTIEFLTFKYFIHKLACAFVLWIVYYIFCVATF